MAVPEYLGGRPTKRLVKLVRMILRNYGIKPRGQQWRATWVWANAISISYYFDCFRFAVVLNFLAAAVCVDSSDTGVRARFA